MDVSTTQSQSSNPNKADFTFLKKRKKSSEVSEPIFFYFTYRCCHVIRGKY
ncbi:hypothetical protein Goklo_012027 [Gossypium klotzschianum]|uniref:Uncharacterized protein n=1 Tax=Gossypium klotzschianum TaxID=34286 RepID=A0A7J8VB94_9ROSI|nr:hypothetical protein [Gossypium klotzschianum]